jgi:hypothetical protein
MDWTGAGEIPDERLAEDAGIPVARRTRSWNVKKEPAKRDWRRNVGVVPRVVIEQAQSRQEKASQKPGLCENLQEKEEILQVLTERDVDKKTTLGEVAFVWLCLCFAVSVLPILL